MRRISIFNNKKRHTTTVARRFLGRYTEGSLQRTEQRFVVHVELKKTKGLSEQVGKPFASQLTLTVNYLSKRIAFSYKLQGVILLAACGYWVVAYFTICSFRTTSFLPCA
jgi:hypothetical protein